MSDLEQNFIQASQRLHGASLHFAQLKIQVIRDYIETHHPGVQFELKWVDDDILSSPDMVFPGLGIEASRQLASEIEMYLQVLTREIQVKK